LRGQLGWIQCVPQHHHDEQCVYARAAVQPEHHVLLEVHALSGTDNGIWSGVNNFTTLVLPSGLTIIPSYDSSITSDPNGAAIMSTINSAIACIRPISP